MYIEIESQGYESIQDITTEVQNTLMESKCNFGLANVFALGSTCGLYIGKFEEGTNKDMLNSLKKIAPKSVKYEHETTTGDDNGYAHIWANFLGSSLTIPIFEGELYLSKTQRLIFADYDNRNSLRKIVITVIPQHC